jgi:hypothetical protein
MKYLESNIEIMNKKYSSNKQRSSIIKDAIDDDDHDFTAPKNNVDKKNLSTKEPISEIDLQNEVYRLQNALKNMNEDFAIKRKQLEDDCCEQLKQLNENADKTQSLQQDLEQGNHILIYKIKAEKHSNDYSWNVLYIKLVSMDHSSILYSNF